MLRLKVQKSPEGEEQRSGEPTTPRPEQWADCDLLLDHVTKVFGAVVAVNDISLRVDRGTFVTLLGPSGCGKTTTLRMVAGLEQQTAGSIYIQGLRADGIPAHRRNVNTVFQNFALFPHMSVFDNVAFGLRLKRIDRRDVERRVHNMLDRVQLPGLGRRRPHELSGGQQQRVALARALVNQPAILLLDEPLGSLDFKLRTEMQLELKRIQRDVGITFIYVTHDQEEALTMSDQIVVMSQGQIEQIGSPIDVYKTPRTRFVAGFIGVSNFFRGSVERSDGETVWVGVDGLGALACTSSQTAERGAGAWIAVRPEEIALDLDGQTAEENRLPGIVEDVIFRGTKSQIIVRLQSGQLVETEEQYMRVVQRGLGRGSQVLLKWPARNCRCFLD